MKDTLTEKLFRSQLVEGTLFVGNEVGLRIDQALTQDATGTMVFLELEAMGVSRVKTNCAVCYVDHSIVQTDSRNADDHRYLQSCAAKFGAVYSGPGNGVSHHVHRQRFGIPGQALLGSDSHTTTGGCLGMLAMGAGGIDVAMAMAGQPYYVSTPLVWGIEVSGALQPYVSGKDVILELLRRFTCKGGVGKVMEFFGPGVENLDMSARATIANMAVDMGCTAAVFPSDNVTKEYLARNNRESDWKELSADNHPQWDEMTPIDLSDIEPLVACPSNPDNVRRAADLGHIEVQQVIVGSSCNGSYRDLMIVSKIMEGRTKHPNVDFEINPGSRQTLVNVMDMGGARSLIDAGARFHEPGCLGCIGMGQAPATNTVSLRTFPRNFKGRSGAKDDSVYLCSPETAAVSALTGKITDPRTHGAHHPKILFPVTYSFKQEWFIPATGADNVVHIIRGPNIKPFPKFAAMPSSLTGEILIKVGDNISTDIIMPAGSKVLPFRSNIPAISEFVFEALDPTFARRAREKGRGVVIGGNNYGQGSSREHAALAPRNLGVVVKIAKSFARIHMANLVDFGIVPLLFRDPADYDALVQGDRLSFDNIRSEISMGASEISVRSGKKLFVTILAVSDRQRKILCAGGIFNQQVPTNSRETLH